MTTTIKKFDVNTMPLASKSLILGFNNEDMSIIISNLRIKNSLVYENGLNAKEEEYIDENLNIIVSASPLCLDSRMEKNYIEKLKYIEYVDYLFLFQIPCEDNKKGIYDKFKLIKYNFSYNEFSKILDVCTLQNRNECLVLKIDKSQNKLNYFWYYTVLQQNFKLSEEPPNETRIAKPKKISTWKWLKSWVI